ncbi:MAG: hypothetical protein ABH811_01335 [archaeon]
MGNLISLFGRTSKNDKLNQESKYDKCVCCKKETLSEVNLSIHSRRYYVEGAGQLCPKCFDEIYLKIQK